MILIFIFFRNTWRTKKNSASVFYEKEIKKQHYNNTVLNDAYSIVNGT